MANLPKALQNIETSFQHSLKALHGAWSMEHRAWGTGHGIEKGSYVSLGNDKETRGNGDKGNRA
jgi:hypothetical protein